MENIKIVVACHKASVLPENSLFLPVQVGSALAAKKLADMVQDDTGDNISYKNPSYCELTAQYWAWKNVEADYYGLCHYRRFLCFANVDFPKNARNQYEAGAIDAFNLSQFGLENENEMRAIIESNDVVVGENQEISKLYTPRGNQSSAYKHWTAHDRALIRIEDLEKMLALLDEVSPEVGKATREYLRGNTFLGFNCFVMKKSLFDEMCRIEFGVLEQLEKQVDLSTYNQQLSRIFGFMGEIISSGFVYYLKKQKKYRIKHVPLVYFNYTDAVPQYTPAQKENTITVFFDQTNELNFMFGVVLQSFLDNIESCADYELYVAVKNLTSELKQVYTKIADAYCNVSLHFIDVDLYESMMVDQKGYAVSLLPFLPWLFPQHKRILALGPDIIIKQSVVELWNTDLSNSYAAAPADILTRARVNDIYAETEEKYLAKQVHNPLDYFSVKAIVMDLEKIRNDFQVVDVFAKCRNSDNNARSTSEILNVLLEKKVKILAQKWNTMYESNDYLKYQLPYAPKRDYQQLLAARKSPAIISYMPRDPWIPQLNAVDMEFWSIAQRLPIYHKYIAHMSYLSAPTYRQPRKILDRLLPQGGKARMFLIKILPSGSLRRKAVKKLLHILNLG